MKLYKLFPGMFACAVSVVLNCTPSPQHSPKLGATINAKFAIVVPVPFSDGADGETACPFTTDNSLSSPAPVSATMDGDPVTLSDPFDNICYPGPSTETTCPGMQTVSQTSIVLNASLPPKCNSGAIGKGNSLCVSSIGQLNYIPQAYDDGKLPIVSFAFAPPAGGTYTGSNVTPDGNIHYASWVVGAIGNGFQDANTSPKHSAVPNPGDTILAADTSGRVAGFQGWSVYAKGSNGDWQSLSANSEAYNVCAPFGNVTCTKMCAYTLGSTGYVYKLPSKKQVATGLSGNIDANQVYSSIEYIAPDLNARCVQWTNMDALDGPLYVPPCGPASNIGKQRIIKVKTAALPAPIPWVGKCYDGTTSCYSYKVTMPDGSTMSEPRCGGSLKLPFMTLNSDAIPLHQSGSPVTDVLGPSTGTLQAVQSVVSGIGTQRPLYGGPVYTPTPSNVMKQDLLMLKVGVVGTANQLTTAQNGYISVYDFNAPGVAYDVTNPLQAHSDRFAANNSLGGTSILMPTGDIDLDSQSWCFGKQKVDTDGKTKYFYVRPDQVVNSGKCGGSGQGACVITSANDAGAVQACVRLAAYSPVHCVSQIDCATPTVAPMTIGFKNSNGKLYVQIPGSNLQSVVTGTDTSVVFSGSTAPATWQSSTLLTKGNGVYTGSLITILMDSFTTAPEAGTKVTVTANGVVATGATTIQPVLQTAKVSGGSVTLEGQSLKSSTGNLTLTLAPGTSKTFTVTQARILSTGGSVTMTKVVIPSAAFSGAPAAPASGSQVLLTVNATASNVVVVP